MMTRRFPNLIHAGVPKSASATINAILRVHPDVFLPRTKETNFFINDAWFQQGLGRYRAAHYSGAEAATIIGDMSIGYSTGFGFDAPERIAQTLGTDIKILFTFREPTTRAFSQYAMARDKGQFETLDFATAVTRALAAGTRVTNADRRRVRSGTYYASAADMDVFRWCMYVEPGHYDDILERWTQTFGQNNILVVFTDDIEENLSGTAERLFRFLDLQPVPVDADLRHNQATALRYPALKRVFNALYAFPGTRALLEAPSAVQVRRHLRKHLLSNNYRSNTDREKPDRRVVARLQAHYRPRVRRLEATLGRRLERWQRDQLQLGNAAMARPAA